jgi:hypothetical protein
MADLPKAQLAHLVDGRVRLVFPDAKGDHVFFRALVDRIAGLSPVRAVEARPVTGSVIIEFAGSPEDLLAASSTANVLELIFDDPGEGETAADRAFSHAQLADLLFRLKTDGALDTRSLAFLLFAGLGLAQLARGGPLWPPAATAFWYAASALMMGAKKTDG